MLKVGIIGCGRIATVRHIPECYENPEVEIIGFYNRMSGDGGSGKNKKFIRRTR